MLIFDVIHLGKDFLNRSVEDFVAFEFQHEHDSIFLT